MRFYNRSKKLSLHILIIMVAVLATVGLTPEKNVVAEQISAEDELQKTYDSKFVAFWNQNGKRRDFPGVNGVNIAAMVFANPGSVEGIVIASGYGESFIKYRELVYDLWHEGYQVYILDHRGQGLSDRLLKRSPISPVDALAAKHLHDMGYIDSFDNFVADLKTFVDHEAKVNNRRLFLLGHSMGGVIASLYLEQHKDDFSAAVFSAPMHQPDLSPIPNRACWLLKIGPDRSYVWGKGPYVSREFDRERELTSSRVRYNILKLGELERHPQAQLGGPSFRWAYKACRAANRSIHQAERIKVDVLLLQASEDRIVKSGGQEKFCNNMNASPEGSCIIRRIAGARHELLIEQDTYRNVVMQEIIAFFRRPHDKELRH